MREKGQNGSQGRHNSGVRKRVQKGVQMRVRERVLEFCTRFRTLFRTLSRTLFIFGVKTLFFFGIYSKMVIKGEVQGASVRFP